MGHRSHRLDQPCSPGAVGRRTRASIVRFVQSPPTGALLTALAGYVDAKSITPVIEAVYPFDDIAVAHRAQEWRGGFGKRVLQIV
jgi:NADPH:quinone reductase-like Zn-dependent oxidoreductase